MGDKFNSGGGDEQVAKDQATFVKDQATNVHQHVDGNNNIFAGKDITINNYYPTGNVPPSEKDLASAQYDTEVAFVMIRKESYLFKEKLKVTWQFQGICDKDITYNVDAKKIKKYSVKVTEALYDYFKAINSGLCKIKFKNLAREGYELFKYLIPNYCEINDCMKKENGSMKMIIDSDIDIPWNSIYTNSNLNNVESCYFFGNIYQVSGYIPSCSKEIFCKSSRYAARDHRRLKEIKSIIVKQFENTIHLVDEKTSESNYKDSKLEILECKTLKDFCNKIKVDRRQKDCVPPSLLFICFDKSRINFFNRYHIMSIGNLKLSISGLKKELSEIDENPPFVIILGKEATCSTYVQLKNLFIRELQWNGIVIDGNVNLDLADKYLFDFFAKFTNGNNSVPEVLFKLRKENNIGLAFTAYCNDNVRFKQYS